MKKMILLTTFLRQNFWWEDVHLQLDSGIAFYFKFGRCPGSQTLISIPKVNLPRFHLYMPISPVDLYKKFAGTDAKALASIHALAALSIHLGGNKYTSQITLGEYLNNLTYQALSQENKILMSFGNIRLFVNDLWEQFVLKENEEIHKASVISSEASTPLKKLEEFYETEKENYLKTALKIYETDLKTATDAADADSEALFQEIVNPAPGYIIDDKVNIDTQFDFQNSDLDTGFKLSNTLQNKIDDILNQARVKVSNLKFPQKAIVDIPYDVSYSDSKIVAENILLDHSLRDMLYPNEPIYFPQPSTDDRKDFELNVSGDDLIIFKSPTLNYVGVDKKEFEDFFNNIIKDLNLKLKEILMSEENKIEEKQKLIILKNIKKRFSSMKKTDIEQQLKLHKWLNQLIEDQKKLNKTAYQNFGNEYRGDQLNKKFRNVTTRKERKSFSTANYFPLSAQDDLSLTSEDRLRYIASIYTKVPADRVKKNNAAKDIFSNIIKQIPSESYKKFKIDYDQSDNISTEEVKKYEPPPDEDKF